jgi:hypothetical protein
MRYFRRVGEGYHAPGVDWGGDPIEWLEVNEHGDAERQLDVYPNGTVLRYDRAYPGDEYQQILDWSWPLWFDRSSVPVR